MQQAVKSRTGPHDVPLTKRQARALDGLRGLCARYAGCLLRVPYQSHPLDIPQLDLSVQCEAPGHVLCVEIVLRESGGRGWQPESVGTWTGRDRRARWECTAGGRARWVGPVSPVVLAAMAQ